MDPDQMKWFEQHRPDMLPLYKAARMQQARLTELLEAWNSTPDQPVNHSKLIEAIRLTIELQNTHFRVLMMK